MHRIVYFYISLSLVCEWRWQQPDGESQDCVAFENDHKQVTFHPTYSSGTAAVRGDTAFNRDYHYYWEIKMLTDTYGTDIVTIILHFLLTISGFLMIKTV